MAERLGRGLQNLVQRFKSARDLKIKPLSIQLGEGFFVLEAMFFTMLLVDYIIKRILLVFFDVYALNFKDNLYFYFLPLYFLKSKPYL